MHTPCIRRIKRRTPVRYGHDVRTTHKPQVRYSHSIMCTVRSHPCNGRRTTRKPQVRSGVCACALARRSERRYRRRTLTYRCRHPLGDADEGVRPVSVLSAMPAYNYSDTIYRNQRSVTLVKTTAPFFVDKSPAENAQLKTRNWSGRAADATSN